MPPLGAARISQAMAPRNGGVTNDAITSARTVRRNGISVRATSQPMGAATMQQVMPTLVEIHNVVISGLSSVGSVNNCTKFLNVKAPAVSVTLKYASQNSGRKISRHRNKPNAISTGFDRSSRKLARVISCFSYANAAAACAPPPGYLRFQNTGYIYS